MNPYWTLGHRLPASLTSRLFGDRERYGCAIRPDDPDWLEWRRFNLRYHLHTQKQGIGKIVNDAGYRILRHTPFNGKQVMEIGPGLLPHIAFWVGQPSHYTLVDINPEMLDLSMKTLQAKGVPARTHLVMTYDLPIEDHQFDIVMSFYSFEHLYPLNLYLGEVKRVLRPGGVVIGAIPTEGGLAWGIGRRLTSHRYIKKSSSINPDKIICWTHPNYAEQVLLELDREFDPMLKVFWPLRLPSIDLNLVVSFVYQNREVRSAP